VNHFNRQLYKSADDALYEIKRRGKNGYALLNDAGEYAYSSFSASVSPNGADAKGEH